MFRSFGEDLTLTLETDTGKQEWKGGRLIRPHYRKPHIATRYKGRGPKKRKEQVLVRGCLVTGERARLLREKRGIVKSTAN